MMPNNTEFFASSTVLNGDRLTNITSRLQSALKKIIEIGCAFMPENHDCKNQTFSTAITPLPETNNTLSHWDTTTLSTATKGLFNSTVSFLKDIDTHTDFTESEIVTPRLGGPLLPRNNEDSSALSPATVMGITAVGVFALGVTACTLFQRYKRAHSQQFDLRQTEEGQEMLTIR